MTKVGLISDTHGLLRPEAKLALAGCSQIIHGGDVGDPFILRELEEIAPVVAVRGNIDYGCWADELPETILMEIEGVKLGVIHNLALLDSQSALSQAKVIIYGHSHKPVIEQRNGALYVNPGSAGPRRFSLPVTLGILTIEGPEVSAKIVELWALK